MRLQKDEVKFLQDVFRNKNPSLSEADLLENLTSKRLNPSDLPNINENGEEVIVVSAGGSLSAALDLKRSFDETHCVGFISSVDSDGEVYMHFGSSFSDGGHCERAYLNRDDIIVRYSELQVLMTPQRDLDVTELDKVVLRDDVRSEIISVLKQHDKAQVIFDQWGLGEVLEYGKGMTFLFYGLPGTGKTWGSTCIAKALGTELIVIGAADIQTSEPGGANRNIVNAFKRAKMEKKVLFLDECDSLITVRSNVGMVLGSEINTLLTEIEKFEGVLILATNRADTLDPALERRISLLVEFEEPDYEMRREIWDKLIPEKMPLGKGVSKDSLAEYKLTGGQIKNVILNAARMAASKEQKSVELEDFDGAIQRLNKSKSLLGTASRKLQVTIDPGKGTTTSSFKGDSVGVGKVRSKVRGASSTKKSTPRKGKTK